MRKYFLFCLLLLTASFAFSRKPLYHRNESNNQLEFERVYKQIDDVDLTHLNLSGGTLTGPIYLSSGSATAPSYSFSGDTDTGIYNYAANEIDFSLGGAAAYFFTSGTFGPYVTSTLLLGATSYQWKDLYMTGSIKYGSNKAITINSDASVSKPTQPCFLAVNTVTDSDVTGDATLVTIDLDTEVFDIGSDFASDTFTAPITGKYYLQATVELLQLDSTHEYAQIQIVTSNRTYYHTAVVDGSRQAAQSITLSVLADMDANDTAQVKLHVGTGNKTVDVYGAAIANMWTYFSGSLIN